MRLNGSNERLNFIGSHQLYFVHAYWAVNPKIALEFCFYSLLVIVFFDDNE